MYAIIDTTLPRTFGAVVAVGLIYQMTPSERFDAYEQDKFKDDKYQMIIVKTFTVDNSITFHYGMDALLYEFALHKLLISRCNAGQPSRGIFNPVFSTLPGSRLEVEPSGSGYVFYGSLGYLCY